MPDNDLNRTKGLTTALTPKVRISFHADLNVTSELLNLRMSYYWRPLANEEMLNTFRNWNTPPYDSTPDFVLMGCWCSFIIFLVLNLKLLKCVSLIFGI